MPPFRSMKNARTVLLLALVLVLLTSGVAYAEPSLTPVQDGTRQITLTEEEAKLFDLLTKVKGWIQDYSPRDTDLAVLYQGAISGMVDALNDPYSQYLTKEQYTSLSSSLEGDYVGVGITIDLVDGRITVINTFRGSPAEKAGIRAGDIIVGVDGKDLRGRIPLDAQVLLRGTVDTPVTVTLQRPSEGTTLELGLVRSVISQDYLEVKDLGSGIAYIYISQFTAQIARDFEAVLGYLRLKGIEGLVIDLRNDPGGLLDACIEIASQLVPKGPIVELRRSGLKDTIENDQTPPVVPTVVLVNKGSASASEILAGAIRDRGVGILVGENTFGKACVQTVIGLGEQGGLRLTIADYYTPSGFSLAGTGLTPDILAKPEELLMPTTLQYKRPLVSGLVGLDVLALQESLRFVGYNVGEPDGIFGNLTLAAVSAFLGDHGSAWQGSFGEEQASQLSAAIVERVLSKPDTVLEAGVQALRGKLVSGHWPLPAQPAIQ